MGMETIDQHAQVGDEGFVIRSLEGIPLNRMGHPGAVVRLSTGIKVEVGVHTNWIELSTWNCDASVDAHQLTFSTSDGVCLGGTSVYRVMPTKKGYPAWAEMRVDGVRSPRVAKIEQLNSMHYVYGQHDFADEVAMIAIDMLSEGEGLEIWRTTRYGVFVVPYWERGSRDEGVTLGELVEAVELVAYALGTPLEAIAVAERERRFARAGFPVKRVNVSPGRYRVSRSVLGGTERVSGVPVRYLKAVQPLKGCLDPAGPVAIEIVARADSGFFRSGFGRIPDRLRVVWSLHQSLSSLGVDRLAEPHPAFAFVNQLLASDLVAYETVATSWGGTVEHLDPYSFECQNRVAVLVYGALYKLGLRDEATTSGALKVVTNMEALCAALEVEPLNASQVAGWVRRASKKRLRSGTGEAGRSPSSMYGRVGY